MKRLRYTDIYIRFQGWARPLTVLASYFGPNEFSPPVCSKPSKRVLAVDFVRAMGRYDNIAGSAPTVHVTPSSNLHNGEKVLVHVSGLGTGGKFWVYECAGSADVNPDGCGLGPPEQQFGLADMSGNGSFTFIVKSMAPIKFNDTVDLRPCRDPFVMLATIDGGSDFTPPQSSLRFSRTWMTGPCHREYATNPTRYDRVNSQHQADAVLRSSVD